MSNEDRLNRISAMTPLVRTTDPAVVRLSALVGRNVAPASVNTTDLGLFLGAAINGRAQTVKLEWAT